MRDSARDRWQRLIKEQAGSGLSIAEFCRQRGVSPASFYQWRKRLQPDGSFVALSVVGSAGVSIELPCGALVRISAGDDHSLTRVLQLLMSEVGAP